MLIFIAAPVACAAEPTWQQCTVLGIDKENSGRIAAWVHDVPLYAEEYVYNISLRCADAEYQTKYEPTPSLKEPPDSWRPETTINAQVKKHQIVLQTPGGYNMETRIMKKRSIAAKAASKTTAAQPK